jgi:hypothetical protein
MILGGALERAGFTGAGPTFTIKGGVALELRLRTIARATKDLDLIFNAPTGELVDALETALELPYEGFAFRRKGEPNPMPNRAVRVEIALEYAGKPWGTVQVDIARSEAGGTAVEMVDAISLAPFGLRGPESLPCLALPDHVAQKIHAMTLPPPDGRRNDRFQDLVDLLLLQDLVADFRALRAACEKVFASRATHPWPPSFDPPDHWERPFNRMASEVGLPITDVYEAAIQARSFIHGLDASAPLYAQVELPERITATTWYFAVGPDFRIHRIPLRTGGAIALAKGLEQLSIPAKWQHHEGGVVLIGVVVVLQDRHPAYITRTEVIPRALPNAVVDARIELTHQIWLAVADEIIRLAKAPRRGRDALAAFLSVVQGNLPCLVASLARITPREAHKYYLPPFGLSPGALLWELQRTRPVQRAEEAGPLHTTLEDPLPSRDCPDDDAEGRTF